MMNKYRIFVDGQEGTTGLLIRDRLNIRDDIGILAIDPEKRKDKDERARLLNQADIVFLCLPDDAAKESVSLIANPNTRVLDASTAHRTAEGWAYGVPELSAGHKEKIKNAKLVSVPGCFATGFNMLVYPLIKEGIMPCEYPVSCHAVTGYSGGGKALIERYESEANKEKLNSPRFYALGLGHKHLPEMTARSGLARPPVFTPIVSSYYRGMAVAVPIDPRYLIKNVSARDFFIFYNEYYAGQAFVRVLPPDAHEGFEWGYLDAEACNGTNDIEIMAFGNANRALLAARFDNLGKGSSGAAVQNMNIMLGLDETYGLK